MLEDQFEFEGRDKSKGIVKQYCTFEEKELPMVKTDIKEQYSNVNFLRCTGCKQLYVPS